MVLFFFYENLTDTELIKKININYEFYDGFIIIKNYDKETQTLEMGETIQDKNFILHGKIVSFNMKVEDVVKKIYEIEECKFKNKNTKYTLTTIYANTNNKGVFKTYIIY
jgi:hypothetical protein